jgi:hypothetical protein
MKVATPSHAALLAENRRLKSQVAALQREQDPISINPLEGTVKVRDFQADSFTIDRLEARTDAITETTRAMSQIERWVKSEPSLPDMSQAFQSKISVSDLKMTVPFKTINRLIPQISGSQLKEAGIRSLSVSAGERPNEIAIRGRVKKLFEVGFEATGKMSVSKAGEPTFHLSKSRVAGLPMPNFLTSLATAMFAGRNMAEMGVRQENGAYVIDPKKMMPTNIDAQVTNLSVNRSGIVIEGGS